MTKNCEVFIWLITLLLTLTFWLTIINVLLKYYKHKIKKIILEKIVAMSRYLLKTEHLVITCIKCTCTKKSGEIKINNLVGTFQFIRFWIQKKRYSQIKYKDNTRQKKRKPDNFHFPLTSSDKINTIKSNSITIYSNTFLWGFVIFL